MYVATLAGQPSRLSKSKNYEKAFKEILEAEKKPFIMCVGDPFQKLVPFWQLYLYAKEKGYNDFYADLMEYMRITHIKVRETLPFTTCMNLPK